MIKVSKGKGKKAKVTFVVDAEQCDEPVSVVGDFNDWDPHATPLQKRNNGTRSAVVKLKTGQSYTFKYLGEGGNWFCDPTTECVTSDGCVDSVLNL